MRFIIFDVGNAASSIISSPNGIGMMIDCGSHSDKENPVDIFNSNKSWLGVSPYVTESGNSYELGLLHITHPDDDHVRNAERVKRELTPYLLRRNKYEEFPDSDTINDDYKNFFDLQYRGDNAETINWGFDKNMTFQIPIRSLKSDETLSKKFRNNSSIIRYIECNGVKILYCGDMETEGWDWLIKNDSTFVEAIERGVDILIASHHGHKSGYSSALFDITGNVKCVVLSKASEGKKDGTDVSNQYSDKAEGVTYKNLKDNEYYSGKVLSTRSNGNIFFAIEESSFNIWTSKASSNHQQL